MIVVTTIGIFKAILFILNYMFRLSVVLILQMHTSLDVSIHGHPFSILDWTCYLRTPVMFRFSTSIYYRGVAGFATDCPCSILCRGLATCLLYVGPLFGNQVWCNSEFVSLTQWRTTFHCFWLCLTSILQYYILQYDNTLFLFTLFSCLK